jgi:mannose-6-phosphate isomerase-like protein (cupin superfamily)
MVPTPPFRTRSLLVDSPSDSGFATTSWGEQARPRLRVAETEGRLAMLFYRAPAGFGPPRHLHRQDDEIFLIEQGAIVLWTPHECRTAGPGDVVMLPKVMPHTWRAYAIEARLTRMFRSKHGLAQESVVAAKVRQEHLLTRLRSR